MDSQTSMKETPDRPKARPLRVVLIVVLVIVVIVLLILFGVSLVVSNLAQNAVVNSELDFTDQETVYTEAELSTDIGASLAGMAQGADVDFAAPDSIVLTVELATGSRLSLSGTMSADEEGHLIVSIRRLNNLPLTVFGGIISGGINRGFATMFDADSAYLETVQITDDTATFTFSGP